jgi:hypothetical protein
MAGVPVQGEGTVDGKPFYLRARWDEWSFSVASGSDPDPVDIKSPEQGFSIEEKYTERGPYGAGTMPLGEAEAIIRRCATLYLEGGC